MRKLRVPVSPWFILFLLPTFLSAQNLEKIGKKDMVTIGGGINYNTIFYDAQGMDDRRAPFTWYFNGNFAVNILDVSLPFTFSYTNNHGTYTQPFNMQSVHPKYKWAQAHLGTTAMNFSSYTLNGIVFTGGGIELRPDGFYFAAMGGRLNKAHAYNADDATFSTMSFRRMGCGAKIGYDKNGFAFGMSYFTAKDDAASLAFIPPGADLFPKQNTAVSVNGKITLYKKLIAEGEIAASGVTRNTLAGMETTDFNGWQKWMLPTHTTTQFFRAWNATLTYTEKIFALALHHEHVDPDYTTFGAYYFNSDLVNWTVAPSVRLFGGKLSLALNSGIQRNNLDGSKLTTMHRWVASANLSASPFSWLTISASYSNFTSYTNRRPQTDPFWQPTPFDTLSFYQVQQQANGSFVFSFGSKTRKQNIAFVGAYQRSAQQQLLQEMPAVTVANVNVSWNLQFVPQHFSVAVLVNGLQTVQDTVATQYFGPGMQLSQSWCKGKLRCSAGSVYNRSLRNDELQSHIFSHRAQLSFTPQPKNKKIGHFSFGANAVDVMRLPTNGGTLSSELTVTVNLGYGF